MIYMGGLNGQGVKRIGIVACLVTLPMGGVLKAQDIPGMEICTVEKTMERRTSCLQSNLDFLQKSLTKLNIDHQQKLDAANRQIESLKASVASLQKLLDDLKHQKEPDDQKASDSVDRSKAAPAKEGEKAK